MNKTDRYSPVPKRMRYSVESQAPLPINFKSNEDSTCLDKTQCKFTGYFNGYNVIVQDEEEAKMLYTMGCFGKGSLSRGYPCFRKRRNKHLPIIINNAQWNRRKEWFEMMLHKIQHSNDKLDTHIADNNSIECHFEESAVIEVSRFAEESNGSVTSTTNDIDTNLKNVPIRLQNNIPEIDVSESSNNENINNLSENKNIENCKKSTNNSEEMSNMENMQRINEHEVLVIDHINNDIENDEDLLTKLNPSVENQTIELVKEELHLTLEESFFLCFALDCLNIYYAAELLSIEQLWNKFRKVQYNFVDQYVSYHYFRSKGWVPKPGTKYGGDFLLYKQGPAFYHSSYVVITNNGASNSSAFLNKDKYWLYLQALQRSVETVNKRIMICHIVKPENFDENDLKQLPMCKVSEQLLDRWVASQSRQ